MNQETLSNLGIVLIFVLVGGVFAGAEMALVTLRDSQVSQLEQQGKRGERVAELARNPNRFLSAVQIGVTVAGFMSSAYGASLLAPDLSVVLDGWGVPEAASDPAALVVMTLFIAYLSLVFGELVPKRLALQRAEGVSRVVAPPLDRFATLMRPAIWLLSSSTDFVVRLLGADPTAKREEMTQAELRELLAGHEGLGEKERTIVDDVFSAGERQVREVMLPRTEVDFLDAQTPLDRAAEIVYSKPHSRYPIKDGSPDNVVGFVHARDLLKPDAREAGRAVGDMRRDILVLPGTNRIVPSLSEMQRKRAHLALVVDEYGGTAGIVTLEDLVEELVGDIRDEYDESETSLDSTGSDGIVYIDGLLNIEDFTEETGVAMPDGPYETVAGYVVALLGRLPVAGDRVEVSGRELEVLELDGRRVARLRLYPPHVELPE
jgi:putative hemolysin